MPVPIPPIEEATLFPLSFIRELLHLINIRLGCVNSLHNIKIRARGLTTIPAMK